MNFPVKRCSLLHETSYRSDEYSFIAGCLQLIHSELMSIVNFWSSAYKLPGKCLIEIERLCSSFLWTGPELKTSGAKVAWQEVCKPKCEGVLGVRPLEEVNVVNGMKLIWRILSGKSLWS